MKFNGKHIAITAGLGAVLALSPVLGPVATAFAADEAAEAQVSQATQITLVYQENGNTVREPVSITDGKIAFTPSILDDPSIDYWYYTSSMGQELHLSSSVVKSTTFSSNLTLTAHYAEQGGEVEDPAENWLTIPVKDESGNKVGTATVLEGAEFLTGYSGNIAVPEGQEIDYFDVQGTPIKEGATAQAFWEQTGVTVHFKDASTTADPAENWLTIPVKDESGNKVGTATVLEGAEFLTGYSGNIAVPEGQEIDYFDVQGTPIKEGATAQAFWEQTGVTVHFKASEESSNPVSEFVTVHLVDSDGTPIRDVVVQRNTSNWSGVLTNPTKEGYVFQGWQQEGASDVVTDLDSLVMAVDDSVDELTFKAVWKEAEPESRYVTVNYYDGDQLIGTGAVLNGTNQWSGTTTPSKDGYTFLGWQFEGETTVTPDLSKVVYTADEQVTEINLYAQWQKDEQPAPEQRYITVNYYDGDTLLGTGAVLNGTSDWSGIVNPTKDGYTFAGWQFEGEDAVYTDAELDNVVYTADEQVNEINLYAQWNKVPESARYITVHFYDDFGNYLGDGAVLNGTSDWSGPIDAPEVDGYTFLGWAEEGGTVYAPELLGNVVVAVPDDVTELTYIAHYQKTPATQIHKVTFDDCLPSTTNQVVEVEDGKTVAKPADPVCAGWTFLGWYSDTALTQEYDFSTPVTSDMTLYAKWQQNETTTGDTANEGTDNGTTAETPTTPAKEAKDAKAMPQTGDFAGIATAVTGIAGAGLAGIGAFLGKKRRK